MTGADEFPFPDDDPETIRTIAGRLVDASDAVQGATDTVRGGTVTLQERWDSPAGGRAVAEIEAVGDLGDDAVSALADAESPLDDFATALDDARTTIDDLRTRYDDAENDYQDAIDSIENLDLEPAQAQLWRDEAVRTRSSRQSELRTQYDDAIDAVDRAAGQAGSGLTEIAGRISPAPGSNNGDLVRANVLDRLPFMAPHDGTNIIRTGDHIIIDTGNGNDDVRIERDPDTGETIVIVNGERHRYSPEEALDLVIRTNGGSDVIEVESGTQLGFMMLSGDDRDVVAGADGTDVVNAGGGDDRVIGGGANDVVDAGEGDDHVTDDLSAFGALGLAGTYGVFVGARGGGGNDVVAGGDGDDRIRTGGGDDHVHGGDGNDDVRTGDGSDTVHGGAGDDQLDTGSGDDTVHGDAGDDEIQAGAGDDTVRGGEGHDYIDGFTGDDDIGGGDGYDTIYAGEGDDTVRGGAGNDYIEGYLGNDEIAGGTGDDVLSGGRGEDDLAGNHGDDVFYTGDGQDTVQDADGANTVYGQDEDMVLVNDRTEQVTVEIVDVPDNIEIEGTPEFRARVLADLQMLGSSPAGGEMLEHIAAEGDGPLWTDGDTLTIRETPDANGYASYGSDGYQVHYNPSFHMGDPGSAGGRLPPVGILQHELAHSYDNMSGNRVEDGGMFDDTSTWYVGPDADEAPTAIDTDGDGEADTAVDLDTDDDGTLSLDEVDRNDDGEIDDDDLDLNDDGTVDAGDGWLKNVEREAVGLPVDHDGNPETPDVPADEVVDHPDALTENALRDEMGLPDRESYR